MHLSKGPLVLVSLIGILKQLTSSEIVFFTTVTFSQTSVTLDLYTTTHTDTTIVVRGSEGGLNIVFLHEKTSCRGARDIASRALSVAWSACVET